MRLIFEGNATPQQAQIARGFIADLTGFYETSITTRSPEAVLEARRLGATLYNLSFQSVAELDAFSQTSQEEPYPTDG